MFDIINKSIEWNGQKIELETGKIARQASGAVIVKMGGTAVLCTVTFSKHSKEGIDFLPLSVHYIEKYYAVGRFPGGFIKREGKPSDRETLISRLIDRSIRPLFPSNYFHEVNLICKVLSYDGNAPTDVMAIIGSSAALKISHIPFEHTLSAVKLGMVNGEMIYNPIASELEKYDLELVVAGTKESVMMIESSSNEIDAENLIDAIEDAHNNLKPVIKLIDDFAGKTTEKKKHQYDIINIDDIFSLLKKDYLQDLENAYQITSKLVRSEKLDSIYKKALDEYSSAEGFKLNAFNLGYRKLQGEIVRNMVLSKNIRIDNRSPSQIRPISCEVGVLPQTHGSALFTRGETQSLSTVTLGSVQDSQLKDDITGISNEKFMLHYNFPSYSVGEVGPLKPPGRREIGHGKLASKAIQPVLPKDSVFPYTIRIVSEITESNGSSSMATVCGAILALMDAGIPIKTAVSGIAMGLILEKDKSVVLSDIMGDEDAFGDMDFKVASTDNGITALQMDIKVSHGITIPIMKKAILQAKDGCNTILVEMKKIISEPKSNLSSSAPKFKNIKIDQNKIKSIIGPGGRNIKELCEKTRAKIDIEDDGNVSIFAVNDNALNEVLKSIQSIIAEPEVNKIYKAHITKIVQFGFFAKFVGSHEGLVHISEISDRKVEDLENIFSEGMVVNVKLLGRDHRGKFKLSMLGVEQEDKLTEGLPWQNLMKNQVRKHNDEKKKYRSLKSKDRETGPAPDYSKKHNKISTEPKNNSPISKAKVLLRKIFNK